MRCTACAYLVGATDSVAPWLAEAWEVVIRPDRAYYDMLEPDGMDFPDRTSTRRVPLTGDHVRIGRRSRTKRVKPEIDLSDALEDTAVSHRHAVLMRQPQGTWALVDQNSTNGTYLNDDEDPVPANQPLPLSDGDRIHVGAWTTITIERLDAPEPPQIELESRPSKDTRNIAHGRRAVEVELLGPVRLCVRGEEVPLTASKERAVLAILALRIGAVVSAVDIEWGLWGETEPKTANKTLQVYVSNLRKKLPDNVIETTAQGYRLNGPRDSVDVFRFERRCVRGRALLTSGHPGAAVVWLDRALDLWRGDPFVDLSDGPSGATEAVSVSERKATAEEDRFEARLQLGQHQDVVADLRTAVDAEPLRQRRWAQLMLALYRCGQKVDALRSFQRLRDVLDQYGLEPSTDLHALDNAIVLDRPDLQWSAPPRAGEAVTPTVV
jgi:DNA-binding SARP family transcriptional activator